MAGGADAVRPPADDISGGSEEEPLEQIIRRMERQMRDLQEQAQQLLTEKIYLENECAQMKKRANRLEEEVRHLKSPPFIIGNVQDVIDEDQAVVRSSNGTVFLVNRNRRIEVSRLKPGARVALNQDSLSIINVLHDAWDPLVAAAEIIEAPDVTYDQIGGLDEQVERLRDAIELPLNSPEKFKHFGIEPPRGVLLAGPPGTGKTMLAKAVAKSTKATFLGLVGSELAQKYIGEGGRLVRELFDLAREKSPAIIFIDEIDAIGAKRLDAATSGDREVQRTLMQLLAEMDGFENSSDVKIIAATNRPELLDDALLRPGRFDRIIEIPLPDQVGREAILGLHAGKMPKAADVRLSRIIDSTDGFSGADIKAVCVEAGMNAIKASRRKVKHTDFLEAIKIVRENRFANSSDPGPLYG